MAAQRECAVISVGFKQWGVLLGRGSARTVWNVWACVCVCVCVCVCYQICYLSSEEAMQPLLCVCAWWINFCLLPFSLGDKPTCRPLTAAADLCGLQPPASDPRPAGLLCWALQGGAATHWNGRTEELLFGYQNTSVRFKITILTCIVSNRFQTNIRITWKNISIVFTCVQEVKPLRIISVVAFSLLI